ncbi:MAG: N-acetyltransferase family protein [Bacteroidaceae bacterium]
MKTLTIRAAKEADAEAVHQIYQYYVKHTTITFDYNTPSSEQIALDFKRIQQNYPYLVATIDHEIVGYCYAHAFHERPAFQWNAELSVYIAPSWHHQGIGQALYQKLIELLRQQNVQTLYALIDATNTISIKMHQRFGFATVGKWEKTGYKLGRWIDLVVMDCKMSTYNIPPQPFIPFNELKTAEKEATTKL